MDNLILSLFPGADLLGTGFEQAGYVVVRGPDTLLGQDIRRFTVSLVKHAFEGVIGGPPCQDFSRARRVAPTGHGKAMLAEFARVIEESQPLWWLMENVPCVPSLAIHGYTVQRFNLFASEFGVAQRRNRALQFGYRDGLKLVLSRGESQQNLRPAALASDASRRKNFADHCELQGLPRNFDLPGLSRSAKYRAVGNGVPVPVARAVAQAIRDRQFTQAVRVCACDCGRPVTGKQISATAACRKRLERRRVTTPADSQFDPSAAGHTRASHSLVKSQFDPSAAGHSLVNHTSENLPAPCAAAAGC